MSAASKQMFGTAAVGPAHTRAAGPRMFGTAAVGPARARVRGPQMFGTVSVGRPARTRGAGPWLVGVAVTLLLVAGSGLGAQQPAPAEKLTPAQVEALFKARSDSARMHFTAADVRFMTGMIEHHGQALAMAALAPTHGASSSVQTLCERIINAQKDEIATMRQWLRERGQPVPEVEIRGTMVMLRFPGDSAAAGHAVEAGNAAHAAHAGHAASTPASAAKAGTGSDMAMAGMDMGAMPMMPGMLTPEQMAALDRARGTEFDRLFLEGMIQHHSGAIAMVRELWDTPGEGRDEQAFKLANDVQVDQATEIARMRLMLAALPAAGS